MSIRAVSIIDLSPGEICEVSGGHAFALPLVFVGLTGAIELGIAATYFSPSGGATALAVFATSALGAYLILGDTWNVSIRKGTYALTTALVVAGFNLKLQLRKAAADKP